MRSANQPARTKCVVVHCQHKSGYPWYTSLKSNATLSHVPTKDWISLKVPSTAATDWTLRVATPSNYGHQLRNDWSICRGLTFWIWMFVDKARNIIVGNSVLCTACYIFVGIDNVWWKVCNLCTEWWSLWVRPEIDMHVTPWASTQTSRSLCTHLTSLVLT